MCFAVVCQKISISDWIWENLPSMHLAIFQEIPFQAKYFVNSNKLLAVAGRLVLAVVNIVANLLPFIWLTLLMADARFR